MTAQPSSPPALVSRIETWRDSVQELSRKRQRSESPPTTKELLFRRKTPRRSTTESTASTLCQATSMMVRTSVWSIVDSVSWAGYHSVAVLGEAFLTVGASSLAGHPSSLELSGNSSKPRVCLYSESSDILRVLRRYNTHTYYHKSFSQAQAWSVH